MSIATNRFCSSVFQCNEYIYRLTFFETYDHQTNEFKIGAHDDLIKGHVRIN